jgi:hypothetical protein
LIEPTVSLSIFCLPAGFIASVERSARNGLPSRPS